MSKEFFYQQQPEKKPDRSGRPVTPQALAKAQEAKASEILSPGQRLTEKDLAALGYPHLVAIGLAKLTEKDFVLRPIDFQSIGSLMYPGKSLLIDFLDLPGKDMVTPQERDMFTELTIGRSSVNHHIFHAPLGQIEECNFEVYYAPTGTNRLHARLVYGPHAKLHYPVFQPIDIPPYSRKCISRVWTRKRCADC